MIDGDDDASADNMGTCADCVDPDAHECAEFPNFKTLTQDHFSLIIGKAAMKPCPFDPAPTPVALQVLDVLFLDVLCAVTLITLVEEVWSRHRVQKLSPSEQSPVCLQVINGLTLSSSRPTRNTIVLSQRC